MANHIDLQAVAIVARRLEPLNTKCVFTGGAIVPLLLDHPGLVAARETKDVDVIIEVQTRLKLWELEERLRKLGFKNDSAEGAPRCRWIVDGIHVDILPSTDIHGEFGDRWFEIAIRTATLKRIDDMQIWVVSAPCLMATKLDTFLDRGKDDYAMSHDIEDLITIVDGRETLKGEIAESSDCRQFIGDGFTRLLASPKFRDSIQGHLLPDEASQRRLPLILKRMDEIAALTS